MGVGVGDGVRWTVPLGLSWRWFESPLLIVYLLFVAHQRLLPATHMGLMELNKNATNRLAHDRQKLVGGDWQREEQGRKHKVVGSGGRRKPVNKIQRRRGWLELYGE